MLKSGMINLYPLLRDFGMFDIFNKKKHSETPLEGTVDFLAYRNAKRLVPKLEASLISINQCYQILIAHKELLPIESSLLALYDAEIIIKSHLLKNQKILASKGLIDGIETK